MLRLSAWCPNAMASALPVVGVPFVLCCARRAVSSPSTALRRPYSSGHPSNTGPHSPGLSQAFPSASSFWSGEPASTGEQSTAATPGSAAGSQGTSHGSQSSPQDLSSYEEYLRRYNEDLEAYTSSTASIHEKARGTLESIKRQNGETPKKVQREYLWTFMPMLIMMCVYFSDVSNHMCAQMAQRKIEAHARLHCPVKWERL